MVDSASIEVNRRARRAKTDRLDALKLVLHAGAGLFRGASSLERGPGAHHRDGGRAPGQSRADGADAGSDAARQSDARLAGDVGVRSAGASADHGWWTTVRDWTGARAAGRSASAGWRAPRRAARGLGAQIAGARRAAAGRRWPRR